MSSNLQPYSLSVTNKPFGFFDRIRLLLIDGMPLGQFEEVFETQEFKGSLERIVIEFAIRGKELEMLAADAATGRQHPMPSTRYVMPTLLKAFPPFSWSSGQEPVAYRAKTVTPYDSGQVSPHELVWQVVSQAKSLSQKYGVQVELIYHGSPEDPWVRSLVSANKHA